MPDLPPDATPELIVKRQRALATLIQQKRRTAKQGDMFVSATSGR